MWMPSLFRFIIERKFNHKILRLISNQMYFVAGCVASKPEGVEITTFC